MDNRELVRVFYRGILGREADAGGLDHWVSQLDGGASTLDIAAAIAGSPEAEARRDAASATDRQAAIDGEAARLFSTILPAKLTIIDIGAQNLDTERHIYQSLIDFDLVEKIVGFEPLEDKARYRNEHEPLADIRPYALGDGNEQTLYVNNFDATSSLYPLNRAVTEATAGLDFLHTVEERRIPTFRLDDVAALDCVDLFKIDIQGYEFEVMKNARRTLADTLAVYTEVEFQSVYLGQPLFDRIFALLTEADFILQDIVNQQRLLGKNCHEAMPFLHATRLFWADAGFVKTLGGLTPDRMIRQAAVSHFVFRWFDHAFDMLSACDRAQGSGFSGQYRDLFA